MHTPTQKEYISCLILILMILISPSGFAGEISIRHPVSFGRIDLHPGGDDIVIAAQNGSALPTSARSIVTGGESGLLQVTSENVEHVEIIYPTSIFMESGPHRLEITDIGDYSQYNSGGVDVLGDGFPLDINIGGIMRLTGTEENGSYSGSLPITLNFEADSIPLFTSVNDEEPVALAEEEEGPVSDAPELNDDTPITKPLL